MKKYILLFLLFCLSAMLYLSFPFRDTARFVSVKGKGFVLDGKPFYPLAVNYVLSLQGDDKETWPCIYFGYHEDSKSRFVTKDSSLMELQGDMDLIKEMGFNTVRLGVEPIPDEKTGQLAISYRLGRGNTMQIPLNGKQGYDRYFNALQELFDVIGKAGLKVVFLTRLYPDNPNTNDYLTRLVSRFKDNTTILAYDFFNEPLYFDLKERPKEEVYKMVKGWKHIKDMYAPHQLCTIGLEGIREVFEWDPAILDVDFVSFHPYEYEPEQVRNEIYWYGKYVKKPWVIGETAIPADGDSVSYDTQRLFAEKTLQQACNCGAAGYSWWQYKDVEWFSFHANFMGVMNKKGTTKTKNGWVVYGTEKPVVQAFKNFDPEAPEGDCVLLDNYYNYSNLHDCRIRGIMVDEDNKPVEGGVILAWKQDWSYSYHTITKKDGSFEVRGNFPFYHWMASATAHSMVRGEVLPDTAKKAPDGIPTMNIGVLKVSSLPYAD